MIIGPAGSGKSTLALRYALSAAARGEHVSLFAFDERIQTLHLRARGLGLDLEGAIAGGRLFIKQIDPSEMGPGEFVASVNAAALQAKTRVIVIDSLNGYLNAMPEERALALQLHELLTVLGQRGVSTFLLMAQHGILGPAMVSPIDVSYLADTVVMLRYFEAGGAIRKAISVVKKRSGAHEETIREYRMGPPDGVSVGKTAHRVPGGAERRPQLHWQRPRARFRRASLRRQRVSTARSQSLAVALYAPIGRDAALAAQMLSRAEIEPLACATFEKLAEEITAGIGAVLITEEELTAARVAKLADLLRAQPAWSDLPIVVFSSMPGELRLQVLERLQAVGNVSFVDRPVQRRTFLATVRGALRARARQYESRRAIEARDQFLAMLGHELRNPLSAVQFATDLIMRRSVTDSWVVKHADTIDRQTAHLNRLVDDLLDVSRVTSGKVVLRKETTGLGPLVQRCVESLQTMADAHGLALELHRAPVEISVEGDVVRLEQVVINLVTNAIKYTPRGGRIDITLDREEPDEEREGGAVLVVRDTGVGIPSDHLESIFDVFSQAPTGLDRAKGGLGLGLTLVRALVGDARRHGRRRAARAMGRGASFACGCPWSASAAESATGGIRGDRARRERERSHRPRRGQRRHPGDADGAAGARRLLGRRGRRRPPGADPDSVGAPQRGAHRRGAPGLRRLRAGAARAFPPRRRAGLDRHDRIRTARRPRAGLRGGVRRSRRQAGQRGGALGGDRADAQQEAGCPGRPSQSRRGALNAGRRLSWDSFEIARAHRLRRRAD